MHVPFLLFSLFVPVRPSKTGDQPRMISQSSQEAIPLQTRVGTTSLVLSTSRPNPGSQNVKRDTFSKTNHQLTRGWRPSL